MLHSNYNRKLDVQLEKRKIAQQASGLIESNQADIRRAMVIALVALAASIIILAAFFYASIQYRDMYVQDVAPTRLNAPAASAPVEEGSSDREQGRLPMDSPPAVGP